MSSALSVLQELNQGNLATQMGDDVFKDLTGPQNSYASRLQLFSFNSGPVQNNKIEHGHFGIVNGQEVKDLGQEVTVVPCGIRCKAMDLSGDRPVIAYEQTGDLFNMIRAKSKEKDSDCMCGVEFLVYLPDQETFTTFYLANATLLREAQGIKDSMGHTLRFKSKVITKDKLRWHGIIVAPFPADIAVPLKEVFERELTIFLNAKDSTVESSEPAGKAA